MIVKEGLIQFLLFLCLDVLRDCFRYDRPCAFSDRFLAYTTYFAPCWTADAKLAYNLSVATDYD